MDKKGKSKLGYAIYVGLPVMLVAMLLFSSLSVTAVPTLFTRHKLAFFVPSVTQWWVAVYTGTYFGSNITGNTSTGLAPHVYIGNHTTNYTATTGDIMFNATTNSQNDVNACGTGAIACQTSDATCILQYGNSGNTAVAPLTLNITSNSTGGSQANNGILVNSSIPCGSGGGLTVQASLTFAGDYTQLTNGSNTSFQVSASLAPGATQKVCLRANFSTVPAGSACYIDLISAG